MKYKCVNPSGSIWFRDAQMEKCEYQENRMTWGAERSRSQI